MRYFILIVSLFISVFSCTDRESEEYISGHWHAVTITEDSSGTIHSLPEGIYLSFEYPRYSFEGKVSEEGKYYIKEKHLYLLDQSGDQVRKIKIMDITPDTLTLIMQDTTGVSRTVKFVQR